MSEEKRKYLNPVQRTEMHNRIRTEEYQELMYRKGYPVIAKEMTEYFGLDFDLTESVVGNAIRAYKLEGIYAKPCAPKNKSKKVEKSTSIENRLELLEINFASFINRVVILEDKVDYIYKMVTGKVPGMNQQIKSLFTEFHDRN